ncbi:hypothetical protein C7441_11855 [Pseudaminobacter salicylatoxidans]|uniref:Uncharacterized protein n=1 Tax=Pseudaminobacter salicylatoxidans TaxID=93369 RepID=A0A316BUC3_PSESE|nr:hypothetical protein [Pseudaminobacter salicylatoxidans]PWJ76943.1 hypothetical protein C7441_11855 [Pseudaminobacter salicylatoxidans]
MAIVTPMEIALTATAQRHASRIGILEQVLAIRLPETCQAGDAVSLEIDGAVHEFSISRRAWRIRRADALLEITLDFPARPVR